jgi:5-methylcytosine-specific restriction protein A
VSMNIPRLVRSSRSREYEDYNDNQRAAVVKAWLFDGKPHREIDKDVLHLDAEYSRGYQSMGILHYLGLKKEFRGIFNGMTTEQAIAELKNTNDPEYQSIIDILSGDEDVVEKQMENDIESENEDVYEVHSEGRATQYYTTRYERDPRNRKAAIKIHGTKCMACGFDFEKVYGERGKDYIEVHHVVPLASRDAETEIDPEKDLIVVCANCHRMIHRKKNQVLSLEELKQIIAENK